ncbi:MAG: aminotransferase class I/II-fold pyridoxal phosphate-dependent enzyme, partial [Halobacteriales archaeon]
DYLGCDPAVVVPSPGGRAAVRLAVETLVGPGDTVLVPAPSFGEYAREVRLQGAEPSFVDHDALLSAEPGEHALAVVCNPNSPTGDAYDPARLEAFAERSRAAGTPLVVDEAFLGFTDRRTLAGTDGVVVARSLTKLFGLPGLRMGFAVATGNLGDRLAAARRTWNLSVPAAHVGAHCMRATGFVERTRRRVRSERRRMAQALAGDFGVHPSDAPFLLLDVGDRRVADVLARARERGLVLRDARTYRGLDSHVRVAVRRPAENDRLLDALTDV